MRSGARGFRITLRAKLALVALLLLALPWAGYRYVREMERFLLEGQEQALIGTARAVATALQDRPQLMRLPPPHDTDPRREAEQELQQLAAERARLEGQNPENPDPLAKARPQTEIARESSVDARNSVEEITAILKGLERTTMRIWVVNRELRVLALAGSLKRKISGGNGAGGGAAAASGWQRLAGWIILRPTEDFDDAIATDALATGRDIVSAFQGAPGTRVRRTTDGRAVVVSAAYPIWNGDEVAGAVVVEETTNAILSLRSRALERLLWVTLIVFAVAALVLLAFATRLSQRIRALRDEAESAIDAHGRLAHLASGSDAGDEIGDLSRSFSAMLSKLAQYHGYLESMAGRLSHELRTPIAVVRSSLENLKLGGSPDDARVYIGRAEEGLARLNTILQRMTEATRLEQSLKAVDRERFDLAAVVRGCVDGYRLAYPGQLFELTVPQQGAMVEGSPDLAAQLLDKLAANAVDYSRAGEPIRVSLEREFDLARLRVENKGPLLPEEMRGKLFESMISVRGERRTDRPSGEPHLGLGLYVARLIAEFHGGTISAGNLAAGDGVQLSATFRLA